jgi:tetratricopeptide (TPR) repeat protein
MMSSTSGPLILVHRRGTMTISRVCGIALLQVPILLAGQIRAGGSSNSGSRTPIPSTTSVPASARSLYVRGRVSLTGGANLSEPVVIEKVCNGMARKEGYTDFKGEFHLELGRSSEGRDATESGRDVFQNSGNRPAGSNVGSDNYGITMPTINSRSADAVRPELMGCELRAALPGFSSSSVALRMDGNSWEINVGTIVLAPLENVKGSTISAKIMAAPAEARRDYQKGEKALGLAKFSEAGKQFERATQLYPEFAAAWNLLGEVHRQQKQPELAKQDYLKAIAAEPQFVNPYFGMAVLAVNEKNWVEVLKYTNEVLQLNRSAFPLCHLYNAAANLQLGNLAPAEESARAFVAQDVDLRYPDTLLLLSNILLAKKDYAGAADELEQYLKLVPSAKNAIEVRAQLKRLRQATLSKRQ